MSDPSKLAAVRIVHTSIYFVMVVAVAMLLFAGITGASGAWLWVALGLLTIESAVFALCGFKCPLTSLALRYGATTGRVGDTLLPEKFTRLTFRIFGTLMAVGLLLLVLRWSSLLT